MNEHLFRSRDDRMLAGVAGGLAELWDADPSLVRVGWVLLAIVTGGIALVVYIVMAIVVPDEPVGAWSAPAPPPVIPGWVAPGAPPVGLAPTASFPTATAPAPGADAPSGWTVPMTPREARRAARAARRAARGDRVGGSAGIVIGGLLVAIGAAFFAHELFPDLNLDLVWPLALVGLGVVLLATSVTRGSGAGPERSS